MKIRRKQPLWWGMLLLMAFWMLVVLPLSAVAAPYASMVMDARNGKILYAKNADARLHPASLTKMMTLYIAFEAISHREISLDTRVRISAKAAAEPPSKLGLRAGQTIALRYLIRAAAIKSANDAATAIGEAISGSEAAFAARMTQTARRMGMNRTTFLNAHGLTQSGHLSTARDMTILGRHVFYDYPQYYNLFSRITADAGGKTVRHTNRALLQSYRGADGIKTGYTRAAGFNLVASAERGRERVIATVFGGRSTASRNAHVAELLDIGFQKSPSRAAIRRPKRPAYAGNRGLIVKQTPRITSKTKSRSAQPQRNVSLEKSLRPKTRQVAPKQPAAKTVLVANVQSDIEKTLAGLSTTPSTPVKRPAELSKSIEKPIVVAAVLPKISPKTRPTSLGSVDAAPTAPNEINDAIKLALADTTPEQPLKVSRQKPRERPNNIAQTKTPTATPPVKVAQKAPSDKKTKSVAALPKPPTPAEPNQEVVTRVSTSGGRHWGINIGRYGSQASARRVLLKVALSESGTLNGALRKVVKHSNGFDANFVGMNRETADLACRRLQARQMSCFTIGPG